ncbi:MAG: DUF4087 domain-containing protein [Rubrivivax sp.]|nr:DUF4087 domain-containing protein [Pyrinomonadaceae bacterium]
MNKKSAKFRLAVAVCLLLASAAFVGGRSELSVEPEVTGFETRCGWFVNPTPANIWFYDRHGEWTIGVQGGYQVEGDWHWPEFKPRQWVQENGNYGYGCACLRMRVNKETHEVVEIKSASARTLATCRRDRALKKWKME